MRGSAGERRRPPARREQQLPADRPIPARQLHERQRRSPATAAAPGLPAARQADAPTAELALKAGRPAAVEPAARGRRPGPPVPSSFSSARRRCRPCLANVDALACDRLELLDHVIRESDTSPCSWSDIPSSRCRPRRAAARGRRTPWRRVACPSAAATSALMPARTVSRLLRSRSSSPQSSARAGAATSPIPADSAASTRPCAARRMP